MVSRRSARAKETLSLALEPALFRVGGGLLAACVLRIACWVSLRRALGTHVPSTGDGCWMPPRRGAAAWESFYRTDVLESSGNLFKLHKNGVIFPVGEERW